VSGAKRRTAARTSRATVLRVDPAASYSPMRRPHSTIGAGGLNFRVRDGNGCDPSALATGNRSCKWVTRLRSRRTAPVGRTRKTARTTLIAQASGSSLFLVKEITVKPHGQLVPVSSTPYGASTPGLSTSSSTRGLQGPYGPGNRILGRASRLYAFSGYPFRT
jgi:hypothetical protein